MTNQDVDLAKTVAAAYGEDERVQAVALGGSQATGLATSGSDIDLYVYVRAELPLSVRLAIAETYGNPIEVDNRFWEPGDEWVDARTGMHVDVMFRHTEWITEQLARVLQRHEASVGYSTCLWHNVRTSQGLFDRQGWFASLQHEARGPYPPELVQAIVAKNYPILTTTLSSYTYQLQRALGRQDWVSVNHRLAAILASYFDILFAVNRLPHPGEKRLVPLAIEQCASLPEGFPEDVNALLMTSFRSDGEVLEGVATLVKRLTLWLGSEGFLLG